MVVPEPTGYVARKRTRCYVVDEQGQSMVTERKLPWQILAGIALLAISFVPVWLINLADAPTERQIRLWTTIVVVVTLWGIARRMTAFRWFLLVLLGAGTVVSIWSFVAASTVEPQSVLITLAQVIGLGLVFTPAANAWFRKPPPGLDAD